MECFQQSYLFATLSGNEIQRIINNSELLTLRKEQILYKEGMGINDLRAGQTQRRFKVGVNDGKIYLIKSGSLKVIKQIFKVKPVATGKTFDDFIKNPKQYQMNDLQKLMVPNTIPKQDSIQKFKSVEVCILSQNSIIGLEELMKKEMKRRYTVISNDHNTQVFKMPMSIFGGFKQFGDLIDLNKSKSIKNFHREYNSYRILREVSVEQIFESAQIDFKKEPDINSKSVERAKKTQKLNLSASPAKADDVKLLQLSMPLRIDQQNQNFEFQQIKDNKSPRNTSRLPDIQQTNQFFELTSTRALDRKLQFLDVQTVFIYISKQQGDFIYQKHLKSNSGSIQDSKEKKVYFSSRDDSSHENSQIANLDNLVQRKIQLNSQSPERMNSRPILEELAQHDISFMKAYRIKIANTVKSTLQYLRRNHEDGEISNLSQYKSNKLNDELSKRSISKFQGMQHNKLREISCADQAYLVFEQYKDQMIRYHRGSQKKWLNEGQQSDDLDLGVTQKLMMKPSTAVRNAKRKLKQSRRGVSKMRETQQLQEKLKYDSAAF